MLHDRSHNRTHVGCHSLVQELVAGYSTLMVYSVLYPSEDVELVEPYGLSLPPTELVLALTNREVREDAHQAPPSPKNSSW